MSEERRKFLAGLRVTGLLTMASRVLGMVRDMATAALLGLAAGGVMDAFVIAFRIPNLFRRLFGEGALMASYLPVLTERLEHDRRSAWQLASVMLTWLAIVLAGIVIAAEIFCAWARLVYEGDARTELLLGLAAVMLPYLLLVCLTAQIAATLHALGRFGIPAFVPILFNVVWIVGALLVAPYWSDDKRQQAYVLAVCVVAGGLLQLGVQLPVLWGLGFRYDYNWREARQAVRKIVAALLPMLIGLSITQLNTLMDSLIAWVLSAPEAGQPIAWLGGTWVYPLRQGAASAIYFGERLNQLPVGILGVAVATVIFPLLSRHAARGDRRQIGADLTLGLRLVLFLAVPAGAGLIFLAEPLTRLLFQRGEFTAEDTRRTATMIACYAPGVWAYCSLPVVIRGFYALGDRMTPVKIGVGMVGVNLLLSLLLVWPIAEAGLAVSTAVSAGLQAILLAVCFARMASPLGWRQLGATLVRSCVAAALMAAGGWSVLRLLPQGGGTAMDAVRVAVPLALCLGVYLVVYTMIGGTEWRMLTGRARPDEGMGPGEGPTPDEGTGPHEGTGSDEATGIRL